MRTDEPRGGHPRRERIPRRGAALPLFALDLPYWKCFRSILKYSEIGVSVGPAGARLLLLGPRECGYPVDCEFWQQPAKS